ncbi:MAG: T9SS type A sorting domain-containing protein [Ignavibacteria bacterium]
MKKVISIIIIIFLSSQINYSAVVDTNHIYGVTIDAISSLTATVTSLSRLCKKPTTRIVFDEFIPATDYQNAINQIHNVSFIMGEILDSYYMNQYSLSQYAARTNEYVNLLGEKVDIWEVGNEVNGEWLGTISDVVAKIDTSYKIIKSKGKKTALTLYYNKVCYDKAQNEMFRWVNTNLNTSLRSGLDYVWISYYEDDCINYQPDWQQVFDSLHILFPNSKIGIGECGTTKVLKKASYINRYYKMNITTPNYVGGYFWWYYKQDCVPYTDTLWTVLNNAITNASPPNIQASQISYTTISQTSISLNWINGNGSKEAIFIVDGTLGIPLVQDGFTYTGNPIYGLGTQDGTGWHCAYSGPAITAGNFVIDGLLPAHTYRVMVLEYNGNPGFEGYNRSTVSSNPFNLLSAMPIELISFTSLVEKNIVRLRWITGKEINNTGFSIERTSSGSPENWQNIGFLKGKGTSNYTITYEFTDRNLLQGKYKYRLKQTDYNGNFEYYYLTGEVIVGIPAKYELMQNYPNPFNPSTSISYALPKDGFVNLKIYDVLGREIKTLINEFKKANVYSIEVDASNLSSGIYYYKINVAGYTDIKKMMYIK